MNSDTLLYLTLLMLIWIIPMAGASRGIIWAAIYVLLQWYLTAYAALTDNPASILSCVCLLSVYVVSRCLWIDPFSKAHIYQLGRFLLAKAGSVLLSLGIKPRAQILDYQNYQQVNVLVRLLKDSRWAAADEFVGQQNFAQRLQLIEGITDDLQSEELVQCWLRCAEDRPVALLVSAHLLTKKAWNRRGSGLLETVTPAGLADFHYLLDRAKSNYLRVIEIDDSYAEIYLGLITIAMGNGEDREQLFHHFEKAVAYSNDHYEVHIAMINALSEKWGGGPGEALELAARTLHRCTSNSPLAGVVAVAHIEQWLYLLLNGKTQQASAYFSQGEIIDELDQAYSVLDRSQLESIDHVQALNALAFCYYLGDQNVAAQHILTQLNGRYVVYPWQYCVEPGLSAVDTGFAIDLVVDRLTQLPQALRA